MRPHGVAASRPSRVRHLHLGFDGSPEGVGVTHRGLAGLVRETVELYGVTARSRILHICSPSFDPSVLDWTMAGSTGAELVITPPSIYGGAELRALIAQTKVTHAVITPAVLGSVDPGDLDSLHTLNVGGDASTPDLVARWAPGRRFFNAYGPTETTIVSTREQLEADGPITIGAPTAGVHALVLDGRMRPVPTGYQASSIWRVTYSPGDTIIVPVSPQGGSSRPCSACRALGCTAPATSCAGTRASSGVRGPLGLPGQDPRIPDRTR